MFHRASIPVINVSRMVSVARKATECSSLHARRLNEFKDQIDSLSKSRPWRRRFLQQYEQDLGSGSSILSRAS